MTADQTTTSVPIVAVAAMELSTAATVLSVDRWPVGDCRDWLVDHGPYPIETYYPFTPAELRKVVVVAMLAIRYGGGFTSSIRKVGT